MKSNAIVKIIEENNTKSIYDILKEIEIFVSKIHCNIHGKNFYKVLDCIRLSLCKIAFIDKVIDGYDNVEYHVKIPRLYVCGENITTSYESFVCSEAYELCQRYDFDYVVMWGELYEI